MILIKPDVHVSTPMAYKGISPKKPSLGVAEIIKRPIQEWKDLLTNDFEAPIFEMFPEIKSIKEKLYSNGALYACMSGSGSSVIGIFETKQNLKAMFENCFYWSDYL